VADKILEFCHSWIKQLEASKATLIHAVTPLTFIQLTSRHRKRTLPLPAQSTFLHIEPKLPQTSPFITRDTVGGVKWLGLIVWDGEKVESHGMEGDKPDFKMRVHLVFRQTVLIYSYNPIFSRILKFVKRTKNWETHIKKKRFSSPHCRIS